MSIKKVRVLLSMLMILLCFGAIPAAAQPPQPQPIETQKYVPGEILVKFQPNVSARGGISSLRTEGLDTLEVSPYDNLMRVAVKPGQEQAQIEELMARGDVAYATLNHIVTIAETPNDPEYYQQWGVNGGSTDMNMPEGWSISQGSNQVTIAILDTGIDLDHPDLAANMVSGYDIINNDANPDDDHGHGTHVAGTAGAVGNNGIGIAGVSWRSKLMPVKVLNAAGTGDTFTVAQGVYYAVNNGARVLNLSLGAAGTSAPCNGAWTVVGDAFDYAVARGALIIVASGNEGAWQVSCPGAFDQVIAVGSTSSSGLRSSFSNYGSHLDVVAPGSWIYSTLPMYQGGYGFKSGTSMAAPHVAGLAALIWSLDGSMTANQVRSLIESTADDLGVAGKDNVYGHGRVNALRALEKFSLRVPTGHLTLFVDDNDANIVGSLPVIAAHPEAVTWSATINPAVGWLTPAPQSSGMVDTTDSDLVQVLLSGAKPGAYGTYNTSITISGQTQSGKTLDSVIVPATLVYQPQIYRMRFPYIVK